MSAAVGEKGWPRQFIEGPERYPERRPNIWLGGRSQLKGDWLSFDDSLTVEAKEGWTCVVCGEQLSRFYVFGDTGAADYRSRTGTWHCYPETNGPPSHPRCFAMALKFCPRYSRPVHYTEPNDVVAWLWDKRCGRPWWSRMREGERGYEEILTTYNISNVRKMRRAECQALAKSNPLGR